MAEAQAVVLPVGNGLGHRRMHQCHRIGRHELLSPAKWEEEEVLRFHLLRYHSEYI